MFETKVSEIMRKVEATENELKKVNGFLQQAQQQMQVKMMELNGLKAQLALLKELQGEHQSQSNNEVPSLENSD